MKALQLISIIIFAFLICCGNFAKAQNFDKINWISFSQLNDSLKVEPKKVFVNFHADWCKYCKEMNKTTFRDPKIIKELNENYYAVEMDVESKEAIIFGDRTFINKRAKRINPVHEIALLLASRKDRPFSLPAFILFDDNFQAKARYFQYLDADALYSILK